MLLPIMETWSLILASLCMATTIGILVFRTRNSQKLPPGPSFLFSHLLPLTNSIPDIQSVIRNLKLKYGSLISLSIGSHRFIFISSHRLTHQVLIQKGTTFSDRPEIYSFCGVSTASYGPTWRTFRHNLASNFLRPSHVKSYSWARESVLRTMITQLQEQQKVVGKIKLIDHINLAMSRLSVVMCFGEKVDDRCIKNIASLYGGLLSCVNSLFFNIMIFSPWVAKILFRNKWNKFYQLCDDHNQLLIRLIKSRTEATKSVKTRHKEESVAYIDTLVKLHLPDGGKLTQGEMVNMCGEFIVAGTETASNALQWIMANLVKHPCIQSKLYDQIVAVVGPPPEIGVELERVINEDNLKKIPYLKAVVLEGLRRHPPMHVVLPHRVTEDVELQGYKIPKGATINFMVAEMGRDLDVWDDPMMFKPERFLLNDGSGGVFDIRGTKGIKMMPFGAGRRMCPGSDLAMLHLEYIVANLIWYFHWGVPDDYHVDLTEEVKFTVFMKNPLQTKISSRTKNTTNGEA